MCSEQNPKLVCEFFGHSGFFLCGKYFLTMCPSFSLDGRVEILTNTSCRHIRAWEDYPSLRRRRIRGLRLGLSRLCNGWECSAKECLTR